MPYVNIQITTGATRAQKAQLVQEVTASLGRILGKQPEHTHTVIQDIEEKTGGMKVGYFPFPDSQLMRPKIFRISAIERLRLEIISVFVNAKNDVTSPPGNIAKNV